MPCAIDSAHGPSVDRAAAPQCEPIVKLYGAFRCGPWHATDTSVCLVMELMQTDLENVIRSGQIDEENAPYFTCAGSGPGDVAASHFTFLFCLKP